MTGDLARGWEFRSSGNNVVQNRTVSMYGVFLFIFLSFFLLIIVCIDNNSNFECRYPGGRGNMISSVLVLVLFLTWVA